MGAGAKGVKIRVAGRLGGVEMHRTEVASRGSIPLTTLQSHIDYGFAEARCTYGLIGVKAWVHLGRYASESNGKKGATDGADA